ncbi:MAG: gliding motility-associated C-terminal domain-containing protein [Bacteroidia bacterium]|nr:gliding motility-associated C-terminal domain-containing protein [Bacteroidia bacterium]
MKHTYLVALIAGMAMYANSLAQDNPLFNQEASNSHLNFIENKGQWNERLKYMLKFEGGAALFEQGKIIYDFYRMPKSADFHHGHNHAHGFGIYSKFEDRTQFHAVFVQLEGLNPRSQLISKKKKEVYHNYFLGNEPEKWVSRVGLFEEIQYQDVYPGIDLRFYGDGDVLKYDFLLDAGADVNKISLRYEGADEIYLKGGNLHLRTSLGEVIEEKPIAYQWINGRKKEVDIRFVLEGNRVTFSFPNGYDRNKALLIDPVLVFATHSGSTAGDFGFTATYDTLGNAYGGGIEWDSSVGSTAYPTTPGAYDAVSAGEDEVTVAKFDPTGTNLVYATYLGGTGEDFPHSIVVNSLNELVIFGSTSSTNFPISTNAHDNTLSGSSDMFVAKLSNDGTQLLSSTFLGGSSIDGMNSVPLITAGRFFPTNFDTLGNRFRGEVVVDDNDNILIGSVTSSIDFPVTTGAYRTFFGGGNSDGVVVKLTPDCSSLLFATYFGGGEDDAIYSVRILPNDNVIVCGGTESLDIPVGTNSYQATFQGGATDGFVATFNPSGTTLLGSTHLGSSSADQAFLLDFDQAGDIYVTGQTFGTNWPIFSPASSTIYSDPGARQFVVKLPFNLQSAEFSTVFGEALSTTKPLSPSAFLVDDCGRIYFSGWGETNNWPITLDALQSTTDDEDFYIAVFDENMQALSFGTYFGGNADPEHVDGGTSRFDKKGVIYQAICSNCNQNNSFPGTPGSHSPNSAATGLSGCNLAILKINLETFTIDASFETQDTSGVPLSNVGCAPLVVEFENLTTTTSSQAGFAYEWDFGLGGAGSNEFEPTFIYDTAGIFTVRLIVTDTVSCRDPDTAFQQIQVFEVPTITVSGDQSICEGDTVNLSAFGPPGTYSWTPVSAVIGLADQETVSISVQQTDSFYVQLIDTNACTTQEGLLVTVVPTGPINTYPDTVACYGTDFALEASTTWGSSYSWSSSPLITIQNPNNPSALVRNLKQEVVFLIEVANSIGCIETETFRVINSGDSVFSESSFCPGESVQLSIPEGQGYNWFPGTGLDDPTSRTPIATPSGPITYIGASATPEGCFIIAEWRLNADSPPAVSVGSDLSICLGDSVQILGSGDGVPLWSPANSLDSVDSFTPLAFPTQSQTYTLRITNAAGCFDSAELRVEVLSPPVIQTIGDQEICEGEGVELSTTGAVSYTWEPPIFLSSTSLANPLATPEDTIITYVVTGLDSFGCEGIDSVQITTVPIPRTVLDWEPVCPDKTFALNATGGERFLWSNGENRPFIYVSPDSISTYSVTSFNGNCQGNTVELTLDPAGLNPIAAFELDVLDGFVPYEVQAINLSQNAVSFTWKNPFTADIREEDPLFSIPDPGEHQITLVVESVFGCIDSASQFVRGDDVWIQVPNAFTPNDDQTNDNFFVVSFGMASLQVQIFTRWGQLVYEADQIDFRWDGRTRNGGFAAEGVYVYKIRAIGQNGNTYDEVGTVTLVR